MKSVLFVFVVLCIWQSQGCSCLNAPFCSKFESASDVVRVTVNRQVPSTSTLQVSFEFGVTTVFKTNNNIAANTKIILKTAGNSAACGFNFEVGKEYLAFINIFSVNLCSGTTLWNSVTAAQLVYLRSPRACGSCSTILCPPRQKCTVNELGVAACVDSCNIICPKNQVCQLRDVQCIRAPCPPVPTCINPCANKVCGDFQTCQVYPPTGEAYCADTCDRFPCPQGQNCQLEPVICVRAPCPPRAVCTDPCASTTCGRSQVCKVTASGEAYCADTCDGFPCPTGQICTLKNVFCIRAPCPPQATCVANPCASVRCGNFQVCQVTSDGEAYCADTCNGRVCPVAGQRCELVQVQCIRAPCPPVAQCTCPAACIDLYDPVCGSDGQTYSNGCALSVANCNRLSQDPTASPVTVASAGPCPPTTPAPTGCTTVRCSAGYICKVNADGNGYCTPSCDSFPSCPTNQFCDLVAPDVCTTSKRPCVAVATCIACPQACIALYQPVCGTDGITYGNLCQLQRHNCALRSSSRAPVLVAVDHDGECTSDCPQLCNAISAPVCGSDGHSYGNECELRRATCGASPRVVVVHTGEC